MILLMGHGHNPLGNIEDKPSLGSLMVCRYVAQLVALCWNTLSKLEHVEDPHYKCDSAGEGRLRYYIVELIFMIHLHTIFRNPVHKLYSSTTRSPSC